MPPKMQWTAEANEKLLIAILHVYDIKFTQDTTNKLNQIMGPGCSGQSIGSQLIKMKRRVGEAYPDMPGTLTTPAKAKGRKRKIGDDDSDGDSDVETTPVRKRGRKASKKPGRKEVGKVDDDEKGDLNGLVKEEPEQIEARSIFDDHEV